MARSGAVASIGLGLAWLGAALPAFSTEAPAQGADEQTALGRQLAATHCSSCHAIGPEGASPMEGAPPFRDLPRRYPIEDLAEALAEGIVTGHPQMPVFTFSTEEIDALLAYMGGLGQPR